MSFTLITRKAELRDIPAVKEIYNRGIGERVATFETEPRKDDYIVNWLNSGYPFIVCEVQGKVKAFAVTFPYSSRECYRGVAEFSVYVDGNSRGNGFGKATMERLLKECELNGFWKLVSRVFTDNTASRKLMNSLGFREVGIYEKHGKLEGKWKDTVIVEYIIRTNTD